MPYATVTNGMLGSDARAAINAVIANLNRTVFIADAAGVTVGTLADNTARGANYTAIAAALTYANDNGLPVVWPKGELQIYGGGTDNAVNVGLQLKNGIPAVLGAGETVSVITQYHPDHPAVTLGQAANVKTYGAVYANFRARMGVTGNAGSRCFLIGAHFKSRFSNLNASRDSGYHPEIGWAHIASCDFFSCVVETMSAQAGQVNAFAFTVNGTGSVWNNIYCGGGTTPPSESSDTNLFVCSGPVVNLLNGFQGVFNQLNIEWCKSSGNNAMLHIQNFPGLVINSLHIEKCKPTGTNAAFIRVYNGVTNPVFNGVELYNNNIKVAYATSTCSIFSTGGAAQVVCNGLEIRQDSTGTNYGGVDRSVLLHRSDETVGSYDQCKVTNISIGSQNRTAGFDMDASLPNGTYGVISNCAEYEYVKGRSRTRGAQIMAVSGNTSQIIYACHEDPIVIVAGAITAQKKIIISDKVGHASPGNTLVRRAMLIRVNRTSAATGAFNVDIRDAGDTTTVASLASANTETKVEWSGSALAA